MKRPVLFIGYESSLREEIKEFLKSHHGEAHFSNSVEDTINIMNSIDFEIVVLNMQRIEDTAVLRYINLHHKNTHVLVMPGRQLKEAIPTLTGGQYELLNEPFRLEELKMFI